MKKVILFLLAAILFFQCRENLIEPQTGIATSGTTATTATTSLGTYYVSTTGSDANDGSSARPWKSLKYAVTRVPSGYMIQLAAGTYIENGQVVVPPGVSISGAGAGQTILRGAGSFYYHPASPSYASDRFLINLESGAATGGNQTVTNFSIDGDSKQLHGGIFVRNRNNVTISGVKIKNTNFSGIWLWGVQDSKLLNGELLNCSWGSNDYSVGALNIGDLTRVEIAHINIDENTGYGVKAIGPSGNNNLINTNIHDNHISVTPVGLWNSGSAPNIAVELWAVNLVGNQFYNNYVDNTISLVNENYLPSTGVQTIRLHHNTIDMDTRAKGAGYSVELTINDVEIDHNYFIKGTQGIANWAGAQQNWSIHHNTFYALQGTYPGEVLRSQKSGLHNVVFYNNTIEFASTQTMNIIGMYGGTSNNVDVKNNLFINNNTSYNYYPNQFIYMEGGATVSGLQVRNNSFWKLPVGTVSGTYSANQTSNPLISCTGARPDAYYWLTSTSPLINAGLTTGNTFNGSAPDIGAFEYGNSNALPVVSLTASTTAPVLGGLVSLTANASDSDGNIAKVEFFLGGVKLGEDFSSPFNFSWIAVQGTNVLTAKATDNAGGSTTSGGVTVTVGGGTSSSLTLNIDSYSAVLAGKMTTVADATAKNGSYFYVPAANGTNTYSPPSTAATFNFNLSSAGNYAVWAKVKSTTGGQAVRMYDGAGTWFTWNSGANSNWTWVKVTNNGVAALFPFINGANSFKMGWIDSGVQVDQVVITKDLTYIPT
jgi:hypothetical protein